MEAEDFVFQGPITIPAIGHAPIPDLGKSQFITDLVERLWNETMAGLMIPTVVFNGSELGYDYGAASTSLHGWYGNSLPHIASPSYILQNSITDCGPSEEQTDIANLKQVLGSLHDDNATVEFNQEGSIVYRPSRPA